MMIKDNEEKENDLVAGIVRSLARQARSLSRLLAGADIGSLPRRVPARRLGKLTDQLNYVQEFYRNIFEKGWNKDTRQRSNSGGVSQRIWRVTKQSLSPFMKNTALGSALFSTYQVVDDKLIIKIVNCGEIQHMNVGNEVGLKSAIAAFAGCAAGAVHGTLDIAYNAMFSNRSVMHVKGTLVSHTLVHGTLFSTFQLAKFGALAVGGKDLSQWGGAVAVGVAGAVAGVAQETMAFYSCRLEKHGLRRGIAAAWKLPLPSWRGVLAAVPASTLGFLAFEYGRLTGSGNSSGQHNGTTAVSAE
ncbi:unnamed protein product [Choristocarpus tenellus]